MSDYDQISIMIVDDEMGHIAEKTISHRYGLDMDQRRNHGWQVVLLCTGLKGNVCLAYRLTASVKILTPKRTSARSRKRKT